MRSTDQSNAPERANQVSQMRKIYESAEAILIWLGPDAETPQAKFAAEAMTKLSDAICEKLGIKMSDLNAYSDLYNDFIFKIRDQLPRPENIKFGEDATWESLVWIYSRPYFKRVWVVQEINSNPVRYVHCGNTKLDWNQLQLVAGYIIAESAWSKKYGFSQAFCWWVGRMAASGFTRADNWVQMMYLASNYECTDPKDQIFGLWGLMKVDKGASLLSPNYEKTLIDVYQDSVEAAFLDFENTDILNYTPGTNMACSWVPEWNRPMLFRNPFRFGKKLPWKPAGESKVTWKINRSANILHLTGVFLDSLEFVEHYNENYFCNSTLESEDGRKTLNTQWQRIFKTLEAVQSQMPITRNVIAALATSFSFGLDENANPADENQLLFNFVAYLKIALNDEDFNKYVPADLSKEAVKADGKAFGKPVWDFPYPESSLFVTTSGLVGCSTALNKPGDFVFVPLGSTYPLILRPDNGHFVIKGFTFVYGKMIGDIPTASDTIEIW